MNILMAACATKRREGGVAGVIYNLGRELEWMGHSVEYLFQEDVIDKPLLPRRFDGLTFAVRVAARILRAKGKYTVVNIHAPCGLAYGLTRKLLRLKHSPPYVMTMHGLEERRVYAMRREAQKGRAPYFRLRNRLWHRLYHQPTYHFSIQTADSAMVLNREAWSFLQLKYGRETQQVWYVPNGVEDRFLVQREYVPGPSLRLLFVGTWLDHKGVYYLRDAFEILATKSPAVRLTIAGCLADTKCVKSLFSPSLHERIDVIPFVDAAQMPQIYSDHDIFVFPSLMEGLPLVLLEAMATGMPVVTTETCGMMDIVKDEVNGLLVPPADTAALVEAIMRLGELVDLRQRLGQAAQGTMRHYTWDRIAQRVEKIFALAIQNGNH
jgi:glycosyltransferase involved in cell wall biosynthesis